MNIVRLRFKQIDVKKWIEVYCEKKLIDLISKSGQTYYGTKLNDLFVVKIVNVRMQS